LQENTRGPNAALKSFRQKTDASLGGFSSAAERTWQQICNSSIPGIPAEEHLMQTVQPRYTMAERLVLAVVALMIWPIERFLGWARRKVIAGMAPSSERR